jgi:hypothetical protein
LLKEWLGLLLEDLLGCLVLHDIQQVLGAHVVSFDALIHESVSFTSALLPVLLDVSDYILAYLLCLDGVLDLVQAPCGVDLRLEQPMDQVCILVLLGIQCRLDEFCDVLSMLVSFQEITCRERDLGTPVSEDGSIYQSGILGAILYLR